MFGKISLGNLGIAIGGILTVMGFAAYFNDNATLNLIGFFYGIPLLLGGLALKVNELKPVPVSKPTTPAVLELRKKQATATQNQIRQDITKYRFGEDVHLEKSLSHLGLSPTDEARPIIRELQEMEIDGSYALVLKFDSPQISKDTWVDKQEKMTKFFGPGVDVQITQPDENKINLTLIATQK